MSVGQSLAAAREEKGLTVEALSAATRIRGTLIRAIETDDFSMCGGDVYARGHIRSIARVLGIDAEPILTEFDELHPRETIDQTVEAIGNDYKPKTRERPRPAWGAAMLAAVLIGICAIVVIGMLNPDKKTPTAAASTPAPSLTTPSPSTAPAPAPSAPTTEAPTTPATTAPPTDTNTDIAKLPQDGVHLRLRVTGAQCWVSVTDSSGRQIAAPTLHQGDVRDFSDPKELRLVIGNAGALTIIYNGKELPPLGKNGAVVHRTFTTTEPTASAG